MKRRPDFDRDRRKEIRGHAEKALTEAKELRETGLREQLVPPLLETVRRIDERQRRAET